MFFYCLSIHNKFSRPFAHSDEIHTLGQCRHINLLGFSRDLACQQGLTHQVGDAVGMVL